MLEATLDRIIDRIEIITEEPSEEPINLLKCPTTKVPGPSDGGEICQQFAKRRRNFHQQRRLRFLPKRTVKTLKMKRINFSCQTMTQFSSTTTTPVPTKKNGQDPQKEECRRIFPVKRRCNFHQQRRREVLVNAFMEKSFSLKKSYM
jgi:hypothetical protein